MSLLGTCLLLVLHLVGWGRGWVDLSALALVCLGWGLSLERAAVLAWGVGFLLDGASLGPLGVQAMAWTAAASALAVEQRAAHRSEAATMMVAAALAALWLGLATGCLNPGQTLGGGGFWRLLLRVLGTGLLAPLLLWPVRRGWRARREPA